MQDTSGKRNDDFLFSFKVQEFEKKEIGVAGWAGGVTP